MTTDNMHPIIRQMHDAIDARGRADVMLRCPDTMLLQYREVFERSCRRTGFETGLRFIASRVLCLRHTRDAAGLLPEAYAAQLEELRRAMVATAAGGGLEQALDRDVGEPTGYSRPHQPEGETHG